jgi:hypothetical protein
VIDDLEEHLGGAEEVASTRRRVPSDNTEGRAETCVSIGREDLMRRTSWRQVRCRVASCQLRPGCRDPAALAATGGRGGREEWLSLRRDRLWPRSMARCHHVCSLAVEVGRCGAIDVAAASRSEAGWIRGERLVVHAGRAWRDQDRHVVESGQRAPGLP